MKTKASGPDQKRKPGSEGLPYSDAAQVCGGPVDGEIKGSGLGESFEVKGGKDVPGVIKGKGGPKK
jgi:hypothetical protein